jgi:hypothetical protein
VKKAIPGIFSCSKKILVVSSEAESAGRGSRYCGSVGDGQHLQEVVSEHCQAVARSERMDAGRRQGKAEGPQVVLSLRKIVDANDEVVDAAGHGVLRGACQPEPNVWHKRRATHCYWC